MATHTDWTINDNTGKAIKSIVKALETAMEKACLIVETQAKTLAPVDKGGLRQSIGHNVEKNASSVTGSVGRNLKYAIYQEFGTGEFAENGRGRKGGWVYKAPDGKFYYTKGAKPTRFLRNAFKEKKSTVENIFKTALGDTK